MDAGQQEPSTGLYRNILLATDGSEFSSGAERVAMALARRLGGQVTALQVVMPFPFTDTLTADQIQFRLQEESMVVQFLGEVQSRMECQGVSCAVLVKHGNTPHTEIVDAAVEVNADLVVVGRRGRRGLARLMLGDATARIVAQSLRDVLVVPKAVDALWQSVILLATDGTRYSDLACVEATKVAKAFSLPLRVISVVESRAYLPHSEAADIAVDQAVSYARASGVIAQGAVLEGSQPADIIANEAYELEAGLVVGGSHGRTGLGRVFIGSVMERLLGKVSCPVLVVKRGG